MKVKAKMSFASQVEGVRAVASFEHGGEYDLPLEVAKRFADAGYVELLEPLPKPPPPPPKKAAAASKDLGAAPENK